MSNPRAFAASVVCVLAAACGGSSSADPGTSGSAAPSAPAPSVSPASPPPGSGSDYNQALQQRACYQDSFDAAEDPLGKAVPCADAKAGFRLVGIQSGALADCPPNQVLVSERQASTDAVAPTLCLQPVSH